MFSINFLKSSQINAEKKIFKKEKKKKKRKKIKKERKKDLDYFRSDFTKESYANITNMVTMATF